MEKEEREVADTASPKHDVAAATAPPVNWPRVWAFHAPAVLIGGVLVMPLIYLLTAEQTGIYDPDAATAYSYIFHNQPLRAILAGVVSLAPTLYAFGTQLRFSLRRYLLAVVGLALITFLLLVSPSQSGASEPVLAIPFGAGLLGVVIAGVLGFGGLKLHDAFVGQLVDGCKPVPLSSKQKVFYAAAVLVTAGTAGAWHAATAAVRDYEALRLGMTAGEVVAAKGQPFGVGEPDLAQLPDGRVVGLHGYVVERPPRTPVLVPGEGQPPSGFALNPGVQAVSDLARLGFPLEEQPTWFFATGDGNALLRVTFGRDRRLAEIWCITHQPTSCPPVRDVQPGMSEAAIRERLGRPLVTQDGGDGKTRGVRYEGINLAFHLYGDRQAETVYMIGVRDVFRAP